MLIKIFKPFNPHELRSLFPTLEVVERHPSYASIVYSTFEYEHPGASLFLLNERSGINLESLVGICSFLRSINYMQESKICRLERVFQNLKPSASTIYKEAINLKIANKLTFEMESRMSLEDLLRDSLYGRIRSCSVNGFSSSLLTILQALQAFYDKDEHLNPKQYKIYADLFKTFNFRDFRKDFQLTGDPEIDCLSLLTYFGV